MIYIIIYLILSTIAGVYAINYLEGISDLRDLFGVFIMMVLSPIIIFGIGLDKLLEIKIPKSR